MHTEDALYPLLRREVNLLGRTLGETIRKVSGERLYQLEETVRSWTKHLRAHPDDEDARRRWRERVRTLTVAEAEGLIRAFSTYFHLVNLAEERHRVRVNRQRERNSSPQRPRPESLMALVGRLKELGWSYQEVTALLARARLTLTFTAHPTETRRRTLRHHLAELARALDLLEQDPQAIQLVKARIALLWTTRELRPVPPRVEDEVRGGLFYLPTTLWEALPRLMEGLESAVAAFYGQRPTLPPPLAFRSWIGGDRDGNPFVTPQVTAWAQAYARGEIARRYAESLAALTRDLSVAADRVPLPPLSSVHEAPAREAGTPEEEEQAERVRFPYEPYRELIYRWQKEWSSRAVREDVWQVGSAPGATTAQPDHGPNGEAATPLPEERLEEVLGQVEDGLRTAGLGEVAATLVRPLRWRAQVFGSAMVPLDLREHARAHAPAIAELLEAGGELAGERYLGLPAREREALLTRELAKARPLLPVGYRIRSRELAVALGALRAWRDRGAYVISGCGSPADVLEVFLLAREVGLYRPGQPLPFDVVPLFETVADLEAAPATMERLLANPVFRAHALGRGGCEVMIGYSDSNKEAGYLAANWALFKAQEGMAQVGRRAGIPISFFHGRGTSTARGGGGTAGRAIASLPPGTVGDRLRLTEQGEALADRYAHPELALRNLEQLLYHFLLAAARDQRWSDQSGPATPASWEVEGWASPVPDRWRKLMDTAAARSAEAYRSLLAEPGFFEFFQQLTPIREMAALKIASRPVSRTGRIGAVEDLRAIPWVMAWTQVRLLLPGWYGLAEGLSAIPAPVRQEMLRGWPFFASVLDGAALALAKADLGVAREYLRLVEEPLAARFFPRLERAFHRARELVEETLAGPLLARHPVLARQTTLRNPYVDPISYLQVELLERYRAAPPDDPQRGALERALLLSILGIAAGLRNAG